ncbi:MAG: isocitrate/isopropylmalate dehydrogenase family protein [Myxococcota bacterium]
MSHTVVLIPGDGIGPEVIQAAVSVVQASQAPITWETHALGLQALHKHGTAVPEETLSAITKHKVALKGPTTTPSGGGHTSANVQLRQQLNLYACIRPVLSLPGVTTRYSNVDLVVVRENMQGLYGGREVEVTKGVNVAMKVVTQQGCQRIAQAAFTYAKQHKRRRVTVGHKANILKTNDGMLLKQTQQTAKQYPDIACDDRLIDALCMQLVQDPTHFDVLLLPNLYGDIVSDLCAGLVGGLGLVPGANLGNDVAVFEAVHGSAPDLAGRNCANPVAAIQSACLLLQHLGYHQHADRIQTAVHCVLKQEQIRTPDLGGNASTTDFTQAVVEAMD